ncbi:Indigoidine synthase A like protein-domain-containing protein [Phyllosticta citribraziliensis]|uniref:Indigoidine synthase A like protein-domain-containing protein n=1 Tax=Phyllosticta citribraziliensis TaxID=989973 RepID=A0ABR1LDP2_9PEZI
MLAMASARSSLRSRIPACRRGVSVLSGRPKTALGSFLQISEEVQEALHGSTKKPVVALESAIYTHGFPYPDNIALSSHLESIVRTEGGVPATVAIIDGIARVGIPPDELIRLCQSAGSKDKLKISRRDLANACGTRILGSGQGNFMGGTTIAGTMVLAHLAGIKVFSTGGLGGVHRDGENTLDISADLTELGRTPVAVISSGCKSFLDIGRTLEYLETQGVAVGTFADGRNGGVKFPGFWSRDSDSDSPQVVQDAKHAAAMIHAQHSMGLSSGLLLANPIPTQNEIPLSEISAIISSAVSEANNLGISGAKNTPFILSKIKELTEGKSVTANRALISSNVSMGTSVAKELLLLESDEKGIRHVNPLTPIREMLKDAVLAQQRHPRGFPTHEHEDQENTPEKLSPVDWFKGYRSSESFPEAVPDDASTARVDIVVAGGVAIDTICNYRSHDLEKSQKPYLRSSNTAFIDQSIGGVAHNIALAANYIGKRVRLISAVADDIMGRMALDEMRREGLDISGITTVTKDNPTLRGRSGQYVAVNDVQKDLFVGMADMSVIESFRQSHVSELAARLRSRPPTWFVTDANWTPETLGHWLMSAKNFDPLTGVQGPVLTAYEPTSASKCTKAIVSYSKSSMSKNTPYFPRHLVDLATPNAYELSRMWTMAKSMGLLERNEHWTIMNSLNLPQGRGSSMLTANTSEKLVEEGVPQKALQLLPLIPTLTVTLGSQGVLLVQVLRADDEHLSDPGAARYIIGRSGKTATKNDSLEEREQVGGVYLRLFKPAMVVDKVTSVNGAGDTFTGVLISALADGKRIDDAIMIAQAGAASTLMTDHAVSELLREFKDKDVEHVTKLVVDDQIFRL